VAVSQLGTTPTNWPPVRCAAPSAPAQPYPRGGVDNISSGFITRCVTLAVQSGALFGHRLQIARRRRVSLRRRSPHGMVDLRPRPFRAPLQGDHVGIFRRPPQGQWLLAGAFELAPSSSKLPQPNIKNASPRASSPPALHGCCGVGSVRRCRTSVVVAEANQGRDVSIQTFH